jgi:16S rRNA processing protein RimM
MKFFEIGEIVKSHGLKGRMKAKSYVEDDEDLSSVHEAMIVKGKEEPRGYTVRKIVLYKTYFYLELETIDTVESADSLVGSTVLIPEDDRVALSGDEYYWRDLMGLHVVTEEGRFLGRIESIFPTGSNDVYVCAGGEREILLPAISDVILKIDLEKKEMVVRLLPGL